MSARSLAGVVEALRSRGPAGAARRRAARAVAAACVFTRALGAPLAEILNTVADGVDESEAAEDARRVASAGPVASARILTSLPLIALSAAWAMGADPWGFFTGGGAGGACGLVGVASLLGGHAVSRRMLARIRASSEHVDSAIICDLGVAGIESGASIPRTVEALGTAIGDPEVSRIGVELRYGVGWARAWDEAPEVVGALADALQPAWEDGASPVPLLRRAASQIRGRRAADARASAEELGVRMVVPLGILLLPAFLALGLAPIVASLLGEGLGIFA
ncbi:type II secretion system F family protein [Actinomyces sp. B33]|uniref:type II secretion system F family protein n=1 Tax=Actinomyces sp. B33 TaxID=2942131 RepID=UPI002340302F|nr:type II secretion system F family protein [Actinomyces sp. B33]MDC4232356.1 type II secretion system F family protein [Actinomyces sp. B33]